MCSHSQACAVITVLLCTHESDIDMCLCVSVHLCMSVCRHLRACDCECTYAKTSMMCVGSNSIITFPANLERTAVRGDAGWMG